MNTDFSLSLEQQDQAHRGITALVAEAHDNAREHGFYSAHDDLLTAVPTYQRGDVNRQTRLAKLALIASEIGEAVSAIQHGKDQDLEEELADVVIRVMDLCGFLGFDLGGALLDKMRNNRRRPYMHGKTCG